MGRHSQIATHPQREAIERAMVEGVSGVEISRRYGVSESSISRYSKLNYQAAIARVMATQEHDAADVMTRLLDLADSARAARKAADQAGTPLTRVRAQAAELKVLERVADRLGINDVTAVHLSQASSDLIAVLRAIAKDAPETRTQILDLMRTHERLTDLADAFATATKEKS